MSLYSLFLYAYLSAYLLICLADLSIYLSLSLSVLRAKSLRAPRREQTFTLTRRKFQFALTGRHFGFSHPPEVGLLPNERFAEIIPPYGEDLAAHCDDHVVVVFGPDRMRHRSVVHPLYPEPPRRLTIYADVGGEFVALPRYATEVTCCDSLRFNPLYAVDI